jgi:outer membrane receptor protein involved in Fe transport
MSDQNINRILSAAVFAMLAALSCGQVFGQMSVTGSVSGTVLDASGAVIPGATVKLTSETTREARETISNGEGLFSFAAVPRDSYTLKVEHTGFKVFERPGIGVSANEHVALSGVALELGSSAETVTVTSESAHVETESSEEAADVTTNQLANLTARGREVVSLLRTVAGATYQADQDSPGGTYGTSTMSIRGASANMNILAVDGIVSNDMGTPSVFSSATQMDAIGEVKVILNSYQAEYAGNGGTVVQVVTKSGTNEWHGNTYWYVRNNDFNANDFFNNRTGLKRPEYRYNTFGFSLGGPIWVPKKWNRDKRKLFGFYNLEQIESRIPGSLTQYSMPTALERQGNFSQTLDTNGKLIPVNDPLNKVNGVSQPFPGNIVPANRLDPNGLALLKILPLPNFVNPAITGYNYNYQIQEVIDFPKRFQVFKIDYVPKESDRIWVRGKTFLSEDQGYSVSGGASPVGFFAQCYCFSEEGIAVGWTHVFSPTLVSEMVTGVRHNHEGWKPFNDTLTPVQQIPTSGNPLSTVLRSAIGFTAGQWYPQSNPDGIIPRFSFNVPDSPNVSFDDRFLKNGTDFTFNLSDAITWVHNKHTVKGGIDVYRVREYEGERSNFDGTFNFSKDVNNPLDTNWSFANAALGIYDTYSEANARWGENERQSILEWFLQDTWKATKRLTLDLGVRWTWGNQMYPNDPGQQSVLALSRYNPANAPTFFVPVMSNGVRMAENPLTGALLPQGYIGDFVPGTGNPGNGGVLSGDSTYPRGFVDQQPTHWGPRFGFAWDVFGNGKTAIRGGGAILYNPRISVWSATSENPPAIFTPIEYYGTINTLLQTAGVLAPSNTNAFQANAKTPRNYNASISVQQDLGHSTLLSISYANVLGRYLQQSYQINTVPYGSEFQHIDPTTKTPLSDNFFRPYPGYNGITYYANGFSSNYNGLFVTLNRRFASGLELGVSYTFSKYMDVTGGNTAIPLYQNWHNWDYGVDSNDQTHNLVVNYVYHVPNGTNVLPNRAIFRYVFDGWNLSGIVQFTTGLPTALSFSTTDGANLNGGGDAQRMDVCGSAYSGSIHTFYQWFNTAAFCRPGTNDPGNEGKYDVRNPGVNNWDTALTKDFPVKSEKRYFSLRWEAYNTFNHTQFASINTAARFQPNGQQVNALFGQVVSTRTPRVMQGSLRFTF